MTENVWDRLNRETCERLGVGPCPFCAGAPRISGGGTSFWQIACSECGASTGLRNDEVGAATAWNRRP